jgi:hypothetical protein
MNARQSPSTALTVSAAKAIEPWHDSAWQRLWLSIRGRPWSSLAIVPASSGAPRDFSLTVAMTLARTGMLQLGSVIHVADAVTVQLSDIMLLEQEIRACKERRELVLLALGPLRDNPVTDVLAKAADSSLLCVLFEHMVNAEAKETVEKIGKERFLGSTVFRPEMLAAAKK